MRIKRLEIKMEYDHHSMDVFHTDREPNIDPPTIVNIDGYEYEGYVSLRTIGQTYEIIITPILGHKDATI